MILFIAMIAIQVALIVDVIRNHRNSLWIMALVFLPMASTIAYLIVEVLPRFQHHRHVREAKALVIEKLDPERELRAARDALDVAKTVANRMRVADALTDLGRHAEALPYYRNAIGSTRPDLRSGEKYARSLFLNDRADEALGVLDGMTQPTAQSDRDRIGLLRARILEELGRTDEALPLFADVSTRLPGDDARCRYAALLIKLDKRRDARTVLEEVEGRAKRLTRQQRAAEGPMYDWATAELGKLRG
ncbi:MAG TPA: hypothetical protein VK485_01515 [Sphingomicrobium sp.]|nr:hypothetical protein [Sphingomicrobium sp.]